VQKGHVDRTSGPNWQYSSRDSRLTKRARREVSAAVRPDAEERRVERRVKRTSTGIWRRDWVTRKMFSGAKIGRVLKRKRAETRARRRRQREVDSERGRMARPWTFGAALAAR
jgi:hypothetical protein